MQHHHLLKPLETTFLADACKALGHPARIRILTHLLKEKHCLCGDIADILPLAQSTVSQHLAILKNAGLVGREVTGRKTSYFVNREVLARCNGYIAGMLQEEGSPLFNHDPARAD